MGIEKALIKKRRAVPGARSILEGRYRGREVLVATVGIGGKKIGETLSLIAERYHPGAVISLGYGGAVSDGLKPGDLVLCSQVCLIGGGLTSNPQADLKTGISSHRGLMEQATRAMEAASLPFSSGAGGTVREVVGDPETKAWIGRDLGVLVVDMESYWIAEAAGRLGLPFLGIRAITDPSTWRVPDLTSMIDKDGWLSTTRALGYTLGHPKDLYSLARLAWSSRVASRSLARFALSFLFLSEQKIDTLETS